MNCRHGGPNYGKTPHSGNLPAFWIKDPIHVQPQPIQISGGAVGGTTCEGEKKRDL